MVCFRNSGGVPRRVKGKLLGVSWEVMSQPKSMGGMGFGDIELFNLALLARQAWRLLQEPDSLSARILKAVYYPNSTVLEAELGRHPLQVWRSIVEGRDTLKLGLIKRIGTGEGTNIWLDNWIPRDFKILPVCAKSANPPYRVSDLIDNATASWNENLLEERFFGIDKEAILNIPISSRVLPDFWSWHYEKKGVFTVRSAYRLLCATKQQRTDWLESNPGHSNLVGDQHSWTKLWGATVPSKIKVFAWRLARTSLPTSNVRKHRNMADTPECSICRAAIDTWRHSLFDCRMARCVWALADEELTEVAISNRTDDAKLWMLWLVDTLPEEDFTRVLVTMWAIWWARRRAIQMNTRVL